MYQGKFVFAQITEFLPRRVFDGIVQKYDGNKHTRTFTCWNQMLCMVFGQLTNRDSLRDLIVALDAHKAKSYHLLKAYNPKNLKIINDICGYNPKNKNDYQSNIFQSAIRLHR